MQIFGGLRLKQVCAPNPRNLPIGGSQSQREGKDRNMIRQEAHQTPHPPHLTSPHLREQQIPKHH